MDRPDGAPGSGFPAPAARVPGLRFSIDLLAPGEDGHIVAVVPLHRRHVLGPAVPVLLVVPLHEAVNPFTSGLQAPEPVGRIAGHCLAGGKKRFRERVVVGDPRPAVRGLNVQGCQSRSQGRPL